MTANPHLGTELVRAGNPDARVAAVLVHGRDLDPEFMLEAAQRLALDDEVAYVLPRASGARGTPGASTTRWRTTSRGWDGRCEAIEAAVAAARGDGRALPAIALVGFSQGACIVAEHLARRPQPYGAAAILTGALFGTPDADRMPAGSLADLPMFFGIAEADDWIPVDAVRDTVVAFQRAGARCELHVYDDQEHGINDDEIVAVRSLLTDLLERSA